MKRSVPQILSLAGLVVGLLLFAITLRHIGLREIFQSARQLGVALPLILLPGAAWQLLRTWGWSIAFPDDGRPAFTRLFRVRLAADAIGFFTVRGIAGEPLKVVLLHGRARPEVTTAAVALERLAFALGGVVMAGLISAVAVSRLSLSPAWDAMFRVLAILAVLIVWLAVEIVRRRRADYVGRVVSLASRLTGRQLEGSQVVRFILDVERELLDLVRGGGRRLVTLSILSVVCYVLTAVEVWIVFWAIGAPIGVTEGLTVETFARLVSVASWAIPANVGALEASHALALNALGLPGAGALVLVRRVRAMLWAGLGLALYPRVKATRR